jgi:hypothetical protein
VTAADVKVLHDAARQLQAAARQLLKVDEHTHTHLAVQYIGRARAGVDGARARIPDRDTIQAAGEPRRQ